MFTPNKVTKSLLPCVIALSSVFSGAAMADPVILPPDRVDLVSVPSVFCFKVTGGDVLAGGGARIQFEVLNWTGEDVYNIRISQTDNNFSDSPANTGGVFSLNSPSPTNGWHITSAYSFPGEIGLRNEINFSSDPFGGIELAETVQNPLQGIDLDSNNDFNFDDPSAAIPNPVDSGFNALDGFILDFPDLGVFERVVLQWDLLNEFGQNVDRHADGTRNPFSFGTFQIDRASNGSIRVATYFSIGTDLFDVPYNAAALDPVVTEQNAVTLASTSLAAVPVPAAAWLFMSGLLGIVGVSRRRKSA